MRSFLYIVVIALFFGGCKRNIVPKPDHFLDAKQMEQLLYDLALLESIKNYDAQYLDSLQGTPQEYIYNKYGTDSIAIAQNMIYYASFPKVYDQIVHNVDTRLKEQSDSLQAMQNRPTPKSESKQPELDQINKVDQINNTDSLSIQ
ncbi:hypothetical protein HMPREF9075_01954 [Capnocytophaga sp. oral taxon 332 str. F0381]|uniref:DUF4296 domain-containing protein n=1 Tax=Capnocytophaga sp. oral taxon 332 TaxID=712213 RepID=UPI0002A2E4C6|nr:DUF4296 domain-containing protein [Capnocytophaga sp. oral taxon 332]EKY07751.1 hypothetical protein HMPREF9075_01954 [Capnocytophaga sp. oral taxon 332 str. F0381]